MAGESFFFEYRAEFIPRFGRVVTVTLDPQMTVSEDPVAGQATSSINSLRAQVEALQASVATLQAQVDSLESPAYPADQAELQSFITNDRTNARPIKLPEASGIVLSSPLLISDKVGFSVTGSCGAMPANSAESGQYSYLQAGPSFPRGGSNPIVRINRVFGKMTDLGIFGDSPANITNGTAQLADIGVLVTRHATLGTGKTTFRDVVITKCGVAIQIALDDEESNCDESVWDHVVFDRCPVGHRQINGMALGHSYRHPHLHGVDIGFDIYGGGDLLIDDGLYAYPYTAGGAAGTLLKFRDNTPLQFGPNNGSVKVCGNFKFDNAAAGAMFIDMESVSSRKYYAQVVAEDVAWPWIAPGGVPTWGTNGNLLCNLNGEFDITFSRCRNIYPNSFRVNVPAGIISKITITDSTLLVEDIMDLFRFSESSGTVQLFMQNNKFYGVTSAMLDPYDGPLVL